MRAKISIRGKSIIIEGLKKCNLPEKAIGLMFKRKEKANALLFDFEKEGRRAIHSFFVFFPFLAVWLGRDNKIIECKIVNPFTACAMPAKKFLKLIEIPLNEKYKNVFLLVQSPAICRRSKG